MTNITIELAHEPGLLSTKPGDSIGGRPIVHTTPDGPIAMVNLPDEWTDAQIAEWVGRLENRRLLARPSWEHERTLTTQWEPGIMGVDTAWALGDTLPGIGVDEETQSRGNYGEGVQVAILDTGLDPSHPLFDAMRDTGRIEGDLTDEVGHGTHCSGIISIIAPGIRLLMLKVLPNGSGPESLIASGYDRAVAWGARIISASLGGAGASALINQSVQRARALGVLCSSAAGNGYSRGAIGSPAMVSTWAVCAGDRSDPVQWATFSDGRYQTDRNLPRVIFPGVDIISSVPGGGTAPSSGTSMACPHATGVAALLLGGGLAGQEAEKYVASHMGLSPSGLGMRLLPDFGVPAEYPPSPMPMDWQLEVAQAIAEQQQVIDLQDDARYISWDANPEWAKTEVGEASRISAVVMDRLGKLLVGPGPGPVDPPVDPPALTVGCVYGTYGAEHGLAMDAYPGHDEDTLAWGPHWGYELKAPAAGRIEVFQIGTPLRNDSITRKFVEAMGSEWTAYAKQWHALADGWDCRAVPLQTMWVAVWWPATGSYVVDNTRVGHLHYGHIHSSVRAGAVQEGDVFGKSWNTGIDFTSVNPVACAEHVHCCAGAGTQLSPNGDLPGRLAIAAQGWSPVTKVPFVPGPREYAQWMKYCAGRLYEDFQRAGHQIPIAPH